MKTHNDSDTNDDYESIELIYNTLKIELKNNNNINKKIEKMLYKCNSIDENLDIISEANSYCINNENKLYYLLCICKNDINKICELYKYNKIKISQNEENELIYGLINPFIELYKNILVNYESKIEKISKIIEKINNDNNKGDNDEKIHSFCDNKYLKRYKINNEKKNENNLFDLDDMLSNIFEEIFEENNFYSYKGNIIKNHSINISNEFNI